MIKITTINNESQIIKCKSFQFDNGFLKIIGIENEDNITEMYLSLNKISMIENYSEPKVDEKKDNK